MQRVKELAKKLWANEGNRVVHTAWQAAGGVLLAHLLVARSTQDVKAAFAVAFAVALAAVKASLVVRS